MTEGQKLRQERRDLLGAENTHMRKLFDFFSGDKFDKDTEIVGVYEDSIEVENLLNRGDFFSVDRVKKKKGRVSGCHENSARLFAEKQNNRRIATGYALSDDNLWRCHSWAIEGKNDNFDKENITIIETTEPRVAYFGYTMTKEESYTFAHNENVYVEWEDTPKIKSLFDDSETDQIEIIKPK